MSKKYLSLEEAASLLNIPTLELMRMRELGEIRGFADRGNWKFKVDDVEALARTRMVDSNPEVPLLADDDLGDDVGEQPTIISKGVEESDSVLDDTDDQLDFADSDSDVRLVGGADLSLNDSDSDVKLVGLDSSSDLPTDQAATSPEFDAAKSDSDVRLAADSDSDVRLTSGDSDSDVSLMDSETITAFGKGDLLDDSGSDSDVQLVSADDDASDVTLMSGDAQQAVPIDLSDDDQSVLNDESGISLAGDSSLMLGGESGISLEGPTDSGIELSSDDDDEGITLDLGDDDSGISLEMDESGISLEADDDQSGISLENDDEYSGTIPMMDAVSDDSVPETQFEIPPLGDDESDVFSIAGTDETGVLDMSDLEDSSVGDAVFDLDEDEVDEFAASDVFDDDDMDIEDDAFDDDDDLDVFDADDDVFDDDEVDPAYSGRMGGGMAMADADWGTGTFVGLALSSVLLLVCGAVMFDLIGNMTTASSPNPLSSAILNALGGLYGG
ncbi:hypothetical protein [Thalassoglobus sp.]|uniref:hypothetical protein n=1 Tax=Thalassoglobus sp. TaxID=2795869 RepID=UPI003AA9AD08